MGCMFELLLALALLEELLEAAIDPHERIVLALRGIAQVGHLLVAHATHTHELSDPGVRGS